MSRLKAMAHSKHTQTARTNILIDIHRNRSYHLVGNRHQGMSLPYTFDGQAKLD